MDRNLDTLRSRVLPAILTTIGVALVTAGLITLTGPVEADPGVSPGPTTGSSSPAAASTPPASVSRSVDPSPTIPPDRVAMYLGEMRQPGADRATYLYAHAQLGMFLPILEASLKEDSGSGMLGMIAEVYTSDDMLFLYEIDKVIRHVPYDTGLDDPLAAMEDQLWLQTSEGIGTAPKLQIVGKPLSSQPADPAKAHPTANPRRCP